MHTYVLAVKPGQIYLPTGRMMPTQVIYSSSAWTEASQCLWGWGQGLVE